MNSGGVTSSLSEVIAGFLKQLAARQGDFPLDAPLAAAGAILEVEISLTGELEAASCAIVPDKPASYSRSRPGRLELFGRYVPQAGHCHPLLR